MKNNLNLIDEEEGSFPPKTGGGGLLYNQL
jgi:hypothetical protein